MAIAFDQSGATRVTTSSSSAVVDITTAAAGAFVYCLVALGANEASTTFTGWTLVNSLEGNESTATHYALYRRQKQSGDTTFTLSWSAANTRGTIGWASYTGLSASTPDELAAVTLHTSGTGFASPSLTPAAATRWALFCCYARDTTASSDLPDGSTWTPPAALMERLDASNSASASNPWVSAEFADSAAAVAQSAQSYTATCHTAESHGAAFLLFLIPGGTSQPLAATFASHAAMTRSTGKPAVASVTSHAGAIRGTGKRAAAAAHAAGKTARTAARRLGAAADPAAGLARAARKPAAGTVHPAGALRKTAGKGLPAAAHAAGTLRKAATVTRRAAATARAALAVARPLALAAATTAAATLAKDTAKRLAAATRAVTFLPRRLTALLAARIRAAARLIMPGAAPSFGTGLPEFQWDSGTPRFQWTAGDPYLS